MGTGTNDPIEAGEGGVYLPATASSKSVGRGRTICENALVMQISPVRCDNAQHIAWIEKHCNRAGRGSRTLVQCFLGSNHIDACAAALPLPLLRGRVGVGEGWGGGKPDTPTPEALAFAHASVDEAVSQQFPSGAPTPALPRKRERERKANARG